MPLGPQPCPDACDAGGNPAGYGIYRKSSPSGTINGSGVRTEMVVEGGCLLNVYGRVAVSGVALPMFVGYSIAPGATGKCRLTLWMDDGNGTPVPGYPFRLDVSLSDAASGVGVTATAPSGGIAVVTGTLLATYVASKAVYVECDATGTVVIDVTDTGKTGYVVSLVGPGWLPRATRRLVTGDYA